MSDIIERLRNSPPREICAHGSQRVNCCYCENDRLEVENESLRAERDALQARIDRAKVLVATRNGVIRTDTDAFVSGKRVALVPLD